MFELDKGSGQSNFRLVNDGHESELYCCNMEPIRRLHVTESSFLKLFGHM